MSSASGWVLRGALLARSPSKTRAGWDFRRCLLVPACTENAGVVGIELAGAADSANS